MTPPTNKDVAQRAGVSIATVSRVVNELPNVSPAVRRRVLRAIKELNYQPSRAAQRLRVRSSKVLGVIISDIQNPFFTSVVRGIEDLAYQHGYSLVLCNSDENTEKEKLYLDVMRAEAVGGLILAPTSGGSAHLRTLLAHRIPVVAIDRPMRDARVDSVLVANTWGAAQAVEHLLRLGHRRIAMVTMRGIATGRERQRGYRLAHKKFGVPVVQRLTAIGAAKPEGGYECTRKLLQVRPPPTALFVDNNMMMLGALQAVRDARLQIPNDLSIVAFDDLPYATLLQPPLTVVAQPTYEMGQRALQLLLERLEKPDKPATTLCLEPTLIVRQSTAAPRAKA